MAEMSPFDRGGCDAAQDQFEGCPFGSVGGLDNRDNMTPPEYVTKHGEEYTKQYMAGYIDQVRKMYGPNWRTCGFEWQCALIIHPDGTVEVPEKEKP